MTNDLLREFAPISSAAWTAIEEEATQTLKLTLAARRLVDFSGPHGWDFSAVSLGHTVVDHPSDRVESQMRLVQCLIEFRAPFELPRRELEDIGRGAKDADLTPVTEAARSIAIAEDKAVFHGYPAGRIQGIGEAAAEQSLTLSDDYLRYPATVAEALGRLRNNGVAGPYAIALGPRCYTGLTQTTTSAGFPVYEHVRRLIDGPVVWAPGVDGAAVISLRGGDFELVVGQDFSIGYLEHSLSTVRLYLQESFTFRVISPDAAVPLVYAKT